VLVQSLALGFTQIVISVTVNALIAVTAGSIAIFLASRPVWLLVQRWLMGTVLADLAVRMAFESRRWRRRFFRAAYFRFRFRALTFLLPRRADSFPAFACLAGSTAIASISNKAPGRASCEMATVVLAGGADMLKC
jgi:hypothetical protein